jgi:hypothetical protein
MYHTKVNGWVIGQKENFDFKKLNNVIIVPHNGLFAITDFDNFQREGVKCKPFSWVQEINVIVDHQNFSLCDFCDNEFNRLFNRCSFEGSPCSDQQHIDQLVSKLKQYGKPELKVKGEFIKPGYCVGAFERITLDRISFDENLIQDRKKQIKNATRSRLQYEEFRKNQCKDCFLNCEWFKWNMVDNVKCQISEEEYKGALLQQIESRFGSVNKFLELSNYGGMKLRFSSAKGRSAYGGKDELPVGGQYVVTCPVNRHAFLITKPHYPFHKFIIEKSRIKEKPKKLKIKNKEEIACMLIALQNSTSLGVSSVPLWRVWMAGSIWLISMRPERECIAIDASQSKKSTRTVVEFKSLVEMMSRLGYHYYTYSGYSGLSAEWVRKETAKYGVNNKRRWRLKAKLLKKYQKRIDVNKLQAY